MMRRATRRVFLLVVLIAVSSARLSAAATYTVMNTNDSGPGSLRQAILDANANSGVDTIAFAIGSGLQTIAPVSPLPTITDPVIILGSTQPGYGGTPIIELSGANAGSGANGLWITAGQSLVEGLAIFGFQAQFLAGNGHAILLDTGSGNTVRSCFLGTDRTGAIAPGNGGEGIFINASSNNTIGPGNLISRNANGIRLLGGSSNTIDRNRIGTDRLGSGALPNFNSGIAVFASSTQITNNLISGNAGDGILIGAPSVFVQSNRIGTDASAALPLGNGSNGIEISGGGTSFAIVGPGNVISGNGANGVLVISNAFNNTILGNLIGTNSLGTAVIPNAFNGVIVSGAHNNVIGQPGAGGNVISGNGTNGVRLRSGANANGVIANFVGTDISGTVPLGNVLEGVQINDGAIGNTVGASTTGGFANVISGNGSNGVLITDAATSTNVVKGNFIGTNAAGAPVPNAKSGISIEASASNNTIGSVATDEGNVVAFNVGAGVFVGSGTGNAIRGNSIFSNTGLGIDLAPPGVNPNDHCDADGGPNLGQNFPVLLSASSAGGTTTMQAALDSTANSSFTVDFYGSPRCDAQGLTAATRFLGSALVTTDASCVTTFQAVLSTPFPVRSVIATATDSTGNTSEFSACIPVPASFYSVTPCRLIDTRGAPGPYGGPALAAQTERVFVLGGQCGIPPSAKAVAVNVVVTQSSGGGHLRVYPAGESVPPTATLNYSAGQTRANNAVVTLGQSADTAVRCFQGLGTAHLVVDVTGYFE